MLSSDICPHKLQTQLRWLVNTCSHVVLRLCHISKSLIDVNSQRSHIFWVDKCYFWPLLKHLQICVVMDIRKEGPFSVCVFVCVWARQSLCLSGSGKSEQQKLKGVSGLLPAGPSQPLWEKLSKHQRIKAPASPFKASLRKKRDEIVVYRIIGTTEA